MGALACIAMDDPDSPTSMASYICTQRILDYVLNGWNNGLMHYLDGFKNEVE